MQLKDILDRLAKGQISVEEAQKMVSLHSIEYVEDLAKLDIGRDARRGMPEVVFGENKSYIDLTKIVGSALKRKRSVIISRINNNHIKHLKRFVRKKGKVVASQRARTLVVSRNKVSNTKGKIGIITAGTSDIGVAEEARLMGEAMGCRVIVNYDVGIAGMHRLFPVLKDMIHKEVDAIVVVAGMEGALASVVSTMVDLPVIGVPTSVGYGFGSDGFAALASMLQSCTTGLAVMNIDNGIGAGALAGIIANRVARYKN
ncbi:MAG: nickel pincer cofactor biosynthesis protein LarB [Nitrososphaerales archaeon]